MKVRDKRPVLPYWQEPAFWVLLALGPACWLCLYWLGVPVRSTPAPWLSLLLVALIYPILEELVFRGAVQGALLQKPRLRASIAGITLASVITSLLFAALHLINQPPLWAALIFPVSLIFGWVRDRYGNIHASTILHASYNAGFVWYFYA